MGDAIRLDERLLDLFSGRNRGKEDSTPRPETPREMERRAVERLYGARSHVVTRIDSEAADGS